MKKIEILNDGQIVTTKIEYENPADALEHLVKEMLRTYGTKSVQQWLHIIIENEGYHASPGEKH